MTTVHSFKDLIVWQKSYDLAKSIYKLAEQLPRIEEFGIKSQIRRSAVSIPSNIAEGKNRRTTKDYLHFLRIAYGSTAELETQLLLIQDLYSISVGSHLELVTEVSKILRSILYKLEANS